MGPHRRSGTLTLSQELWEARGRSLEQGNTVPSEELQAVVLPSTLTQDQRPEMAGLP